jgi:hypothetical protein
MYGYESSATLTTDRLHYKLQTRPLVREGAPVFENRVLRIFGPKGDEVTGEWRKLHNEELHDLYSSPCIIRIIKPRKMR